VGVQHPQQMIGQTMLLFLRGHSCHPRNQLRAEITKEFFMLEGLGTDFFNAKGDTLLAQIWTALHFGDYLAYYLAMAYGVQPATVEAVEGLKAYMKEE
jgi:glucose/mannose-6-phosphate isomerase